MDQELTYKWIQDRLRELNSGTLSEKDRERLVAIAKDDPFVADALEGFRTHPESKHNVHLERIAHKIRQSKRTRRRWLIPNLTVTAVAASVFLIIATYAVITRIENQSEESIFVLLEPDSLKATDTIGKDLAIESESSVPAGNDALKVESTSSRKESMPSSGAAAAPEKKISAKSSSSSPTDIVKNDDIAAEIPTSVEPIVTPPGSKVLSAEREDEVILDIALGAQPEIARASRDEGYYANQMDPAIMQQRISGRVLNAINDEPLRSAQISVSYSNQLFLTDNDGNFELFIPEAEVVVHVAFPGSVDSTIIIRQGEENILVALRPGAILPTSKAPESQKKGPVPSANRKVSDSFLNFKRHVATASVLQLTTDPNSARRKVMVEFDISNSGRPTNIRVAESSRDKTYDGEAIRLIESGPDWACLRGANPCKRTYTFYFR